MKISRDFRLFQVKEDDLAIYIITYSPSALNVS